MPRSKRRTNPEDRVVKKIGKWTIAWVNGHLRVDNGWNSEYPVWHDHTQVAAYDFPERIPESVKAAVIKEFKKKNNPQRIPNGRLVPARIRHKGKTYPGKVKRVNGKVKIFVTPQVARKINPRANLTQKYWSIQGRYGRAWEEVTAEEWKHGVDSGRKEALKRLREYRENEPGTAFRLVLKREKIA